MLRKRSRAIGGKQGLMSDPHSLRSPSGSSCNKPRASALFPSPRLLVGFPSSGCSDPEAAMSPTSILETKNLSSIRNHFLSEKKPPFDATPTSGAACADSTQHPWRNGDSKAVGLGLIDALNEEKSKRASSTGRSRMVLFGSQLKIQIPSLCPGSISPVGSPIEFGIKNKGSQLALLSPAQRSLGSEMPASSPRVFTGSIPMSEMELSEDYTCVISHGPNPRTTHIFDNCVVESCGDGFTPLTKGGSSAADRRGYPLNDFLSFCYTCKKNLGQGKDTFMYRGEKAFCSSECRNKEMLNDDGIDKLSKESPLTM